MQFQTIDPASIINLNVPNYSHGIQASGARNWVQLSGQVGVAPDGSVPEDFTEQCRQAFSNIGACLAQAAMTSENVVMLRIFLIDREDLADLRRVRAEFFGDRKLPSTLVFVSGLVDPDWRVELEVTAAN